jgi:hypothetical protein
VKYCRLCSAIFASSCWRAFTRSETYAWSKAFPASVVDKTLKARGRTHGVNRMKGMMGQSCRYLKTGAGNGKSSANVSPHSPARHSFDSTLGIGLRASAYKSIIASHDAPG